MVSQGNTPEEMERKLHDYLAAGVRQVWYVYPASRHLRIYSTPQRHTALNDQQTLDGGDVLPGFRLELRRFFAEPGQATDS